MYFDSFGIEYVLQELLSKFKDKATTHNIFKIQDHDSIMCGFCCIAFIEYMLAGKTLLNYTIKRMTRQYINTLKTNMAKEKQTLNLDVKRMNETRNYLIEEIINDLMSKTQKYT